MAEEITWNINSQQQRTCKRIKNQQWTANNMKEVTMIISHTKMRDERCNSKWEKESVLREKKFDFRQLRKKLSNYYYFFQKYFPGPILLKVRSFWGPDFFRSNFFTRSGPGSDFFFDPVPDFFFTRTRTGLSDYFDPDFFRSNFWPDF